MRKHPELLKRIEKIKIYRQNSDRDATKKLAATPYLFGEIRQPKSEYIFIPKVSSESRPFIPIGFLSKTIIASGSALVIPNAGKYHFGVLTSIMHNSWMRYTCGRMKSDYQYSNSIVYNNYPWPESPTPAQKLSVEKAAHAVLDAREKFPDSSLADLYDPNTMPKVLTDAHRHLDSVVDKCYRAKPFESELERIEFLFAMYEKYTKEMTLFPVEEKQIKAKKKTKRDSL